MGTIKTTMTADAQQLINEQKRVGQSAAEVNNEYREASRELAQMGRVSSQVYREMQTPLDKYNQRIEALNNDLDKGKISQEQYAKAVEHVRDKYREADGHGKGFQNTLMQIGAQAAGLYSVANAFSEVREMLAATREEAEKSAQLLEAKFTGRGELIQVVDTPAQADALINAWRTRGGATTNEAASTAAFSMISASLQNEMDSLMKISGGGLVGIETMPTLMASLKGISDAFNGEPGSVNQMVSKAIIASTKANAKIPEMVRYASLTAKPAQSVGLGDEQTLAAIATIADSLGGVENAQTRLSALFGVLNKKGVKGSTVSELVSAVQKSGKSDREFIGDNEGAIVGFRSIRDMLPAIEQTAREIDQGNTGEALRRKLGVLAADPLQRSIMQQQASEALNEQALQGIGQRELLIQNVLRNQDTVYQQQGWGSAFRYFSRKAQNSGLPFFDVRMDPGFLQTGQLFSDNKLNRDEAAAKAEGNTLLVEAIQELRKSQEELTAFLKQERTRDRQRPTVPKPDRGG